MTLTGALSTLQRREHRALIKAIDSLAQQSIQKGCKNLNVVYRTDNHAKALIKNGLLPRNSYLGRMKLFGMPYLERVAVNVPLSYLIKQEEDIKIFIEDNFSDFCEDVFNALVIASVIAGSNGYWQMSSQVNSRILSRIGVMPDTASKSKILRNPESILALVSAY